MSVSNTTKNANTVLAVMAIAKKSESVATPAYGPARFISDVFRIV
jgi:hypothetical protein